MTPEHELPNLLANASFPMTKQELLALVNTDNASREVRKAVNALPDERFDCLDDVVRVLGSG